MLPLYSLLKPRFGLQSMVVTEHRMVVLPEHLGRQNTRTHTYTQGRNVNHGWLHLAKALRIYQVTATSFCSENCFDRSCQIAFFKYLVISFLFKACQSDHFFNLLIMSLQFQNVQARDFIVLLLSFRVRVFIDNTFNVAAT